MRVRIFRNLNRGTWSVHVRTAGAWRTVAHVRQINVTDAIFHCSEASRLRCVARGQRDVHAWVEGTLDAVRLADAVLVDKWATAEIRAAFAACDAAAVAPLPRAVTYSPFLRPGFYVKASGADIAAADAVAFTMEAGCTA